MTNLDLITPAVHMNGNSKESLIQEWKEFNQALQDVCKAFPYDSFHSRNHYVKDGEDTIIRVNQARFEMLQELSKLQRQSEEVIWNLTK
jgi:hypothetical protein